MQKTALIVAGGSGKRMGSEIPKQFLELNGVPILIRTLEKFLNLDTDLRIVLVLPKSHFGFWEELSFKYLSNDFLSRIHLAEGGDSRVASVHAGLIELNNYVANAESCLVAIHDGVRPFVSHKIIETSYKLAQEKGASVVCVPLKASIRQKIDENKSQAVDRSLYYEVQTPQTFLFSQIFKAYTERSNDQFTDDASIYEKIIGDVDICEGSYENIKITSPEDMFVGSRILEGLNTEENNKTSFPRIKMVILDVDGTLTDGGIYLDSEGKQTRKFNTHDSLAIHRLITRYGMRFGLISGGTDPSILQVYAEKHNISHIYAGSEPKLDTIEMWLENLNLSLSDIAYVGDDWNDVPIMERVGLSACPANTPKHIQKYANVVLTANGGQGAIREFLEEVLGYNIKR